MNIGEEIRNGDVLGIVQDKSEVQSPYDGTVVSLSRMNYLFEGDMVASIASPLVDQPVEEDVDQPTEPAPRRKW